MKDSRKNDPPLLHMKSSSSSRLISTVLRLNFLILFSFERIGHDLTLIFNVLVELMCNFEITFARQVDFMNVVEVARSVQLLLEWLLMDILFYLRTKLLELIRGNVLILKRLHFGCKGSRFIQKLLKPLISLPWVRKISLVELGIF